MPPAHLIPGHGLGEQVNDIATYLLRTRSTSWLGSNSSTQLRAEVRECRDHPSVINCGASGIQYFFDEEPY